MSWSLIGSVSAGGISGIETGPLDTTGANLICVAVSQYAVESPGTVTDSNGNAWNPLNAYKGQPQYVQLWYCASPVTSTDHTFSYSGDDASITAIAFSGASNRPFDVQNGNGVDTFVTTIQPGSITPSQNGALVITAFSFGVSQESVTINSGFSTPITINYGSVTGAEGLSVSYLVQDTAAAINPTWSWSSSTPASAAIASFLPASGGTSPTLPTGTFPLIGGATILIPDAIALPVTGLAWVIERRNRLGRLRRKPGVFPLVRG